MVGIEKKVESESEPYTREAQFIISDIQTGQTRRQVILISLLLRVECNVKLGEQTQGVTKIRFSWLWASRIIHLFVWKIL